MRYWCVVLCFLHRSSRRHTQLWLNAIMIKKKRKIFSIPAPKDWYISFQTLSQSLKLVAQLCRSSDVRYSLKILTTDGIQYEPWLRRGIVRKATLASSSCNQLKEKQYNWQGFTFDHNIVYISCAYCQWLCILHAILLQCVSLLRMHPFPGLLK